MALQEGVKARLAEAAASERASLALSATNGAAPSDAADDEAEEDEDDGAGSRDSDSLASPSPAGVPAAAPESGAPLHVTQFGTAFKVQRTSMHVIHHRI